MDIFVEDCRGGVQLYEPEAEGGYWYVMQTPRNKALRVKTFFAENGIEAIVPLHYQDVVCRGKLSRELVSALDNYIYVKADLERMRWIKRHLPYLTYVKEESFDGRMQKYQAYFGNEIVDLFRLLETNYLGDMMIVDSEDVSDDNFTQIIAKDGILKDIPLSFECVRGVDHKCMTMTLDYGVVIAVKSLTPESFMTQDCEMTQIIDGKCVTTHYPLLEVAN